MKLSSPITLIKKSVEIFFDKKNLPSLLKIYLPLVPFTLFSMWQSSFVKDFENTKDPKMVLLVFLVNISYLVIYLWVWVSAVILIKSIIRESKYNLSEIYKKAWKMVGGFLWLSVVLFLITLGGVLLLVVPALIFGVWYSFAKFIYIDGGEIKESLVKSKELVKDRFWKILGRYFVFGLVAALANIVLVAVPYGIGSVATTLLGGLFILPSYLLFLEIKNS